MKDSKIINFHGAWERTLVNTIHSAPCATPSEVEDGIERNVKRPLVFTRAIVGVGERGCSVEIKSDIIFGPFHAIGVECGFCIAYVFLPMLNRRAAIVVFGAVDSARHLVGDTTHLFHNVDFAAMRPRIGTEIIVGGHHPECRPCAFSFGQLNRSLEIAILVAGGIVGIDTPRIDFAFILETIDIDVLNKEIEEIVARENVLREEIKKIIEEIEVA